MPTRRPRHTITETPPVERAVRRLRAVIRDDLIAAHRELRLRRVWIPARGTVA